MKYVLVTKLGAAALLSLGLVAPASTLHVEQVASVASLSTIVTAHAAGDITP